VLAARRAEVGTVVLPAENEPDLEELPPEVRDSTRFVLADTMGQVLGAAFADAGTARSRYRRRNELPSAAQAGSASGRPARRAG
jgi:ATP-dependent Lon protease